MLDRRTFLERMGQTWAAGVGLGMLGIVPQSHAADADPSSSPKRMAVITTEWRYHSHAWHMAERFLHGYPINGFWHRPPIQVVSAYVDQHPENDLAPSRAKEYGFPIYGSIAEALRCGGDKLAVDAVLVIGEHGDYPLNEYGQKQYPRYEFFKQVAEVFEKDGKVAPVFNDKHLSWSFQKAKEMVEISKRLNFPFLAGSSLPVTWRMPSIDLPMGAEVEEVMCIAMGAVDIYDFHALETVQSFVERRKGGETGITAIQGLQGDAVWKAMEVGNWAGGGWDPKLFEACLSRSHTLHQPETFSHRYPTPEQIREWVKKPIAYRFEYADGLKGTMLLMNGLVDDFTLSVRLKGGDQYLSTLYQLPPNPNVVYSAALMGKAEEMFLTGKAPYPIERTLLTSGMVEAAMHSLHRQSERITTPWLNVAYAAPQESQFFQK